jgi:tetratricopeptide (TPR) repeat protein
LIPFTKQSCATSDSISTFSKLDSWIQWATSEHDKELVLEFEFLKLKYYSGGKQVNYTLFEHLVPCFITRLEKHNFIKAKVLHALAHHYFHTTLEFNKAFDTYHEMYIILKDLNIDEFPLKRYLLYDYGIAFYAFDDFDNARKYFYEVTEQNHNNAQWINFQTYNTLGLIYRKMNDYDSSSLFFKKAWQAGVYKKDSVQISIALGNMGHNYFLQKQYFVAVPLLELDAKYSSRYNEWANGAAALISLAEISFIQGKTGKAEQQCLQALKWLELSYRKEEYAYYNTAYTLLAKVHAAKKETGLAYMYMALAATTKDSLNMKMNANILFTATRKIEAGLHLAEIEHFENERKAQIIFRNAVITILFLLMVITLLIYNRKQVKNKQEHLLMQTQKKLVEEELVTATERLNSFTHSVIEKSELIEKLQRELDVQSSDALQSLHQHIILTDNDWEEFRQLFEQAHNGYLHRLKEKHPELSQAEIRFMVLAKLMFTSKQMATTLGITQDAIRMMRYRLRKKLGLNEEDNLEDLILNI